MKRYRICVEGHLGSEWSDRLMDWKFSTEGTQTELDGFLTDQATLQGLFKMFRNAGIAIVSVNPISESQED